MKDWWKNNVLIATSLITSRKGRHFLLLCSTALAILMCGLGVTLLSSWLQKNVLVMVFWWLAVLFLVLFMSGVALLEIASIKAWQRKQEREYLEKIKK